MIVYRKLIIVFLLLSAVVFVGGAYGYSQKDAECELDSGGKGEVEPKAEITVYVCGGVNHPGVIQLHEGDRVIDAVKACGGVLPVADTQAINMAKMLKDGEQVRIPEQAVAGEQVVIGGAQKTGVKGTLVNLNTASADELDTLPGVGPSTAKAIVEYRQAQGMFAAIEDVKKVRGIGEAKFQKMSEKICI